LHCGGFLESCPHGGQKICAVLIILHVVARDVAHKLSYHRCHKGGLSDGFIDKLGACNARLISNVQIWARQILILAQQIAARVSGAKRYKVIGCHVFLLQKIYHKKSEQDT
jgi:hypothetical protein